MIALLDLAQLDDDGGGPPPIDKGEDLFCPKCNQQLDPKADVGYGLAYGGGLGTYYACPDEDNCDWHYKIIDVNAN